MLLPLLFTLALTLGHTQAHEDTNPQITTAPSLSEYTLALALHARAKQPPSTSLGSADALVYCQNSAPGCANQLSLFDSCSSIYGTDLKYLYCLCTTGYHDAVSECDACSASLGALDWAQVSSDKAEAQTECVSLSGEYGTKTGTKTGGGTKAGTKTGTKTGVEAETQATGAIASKTSSTSSSSLVITLPTEPYAGLAGQPTMPGGDAAATSTSRGAAAAVTGMLDQTGRIGLVAGMVCLGGVILL